MPDPRTLRPMLATLVEAPFSREGWLFEPKLDGVRTLAFLHDGKVDLRSRRGNQASVQYPEVVEARRGAERGDRGLRRRDRRASTSAACPTSRSCSRASTSRGPPRSRASPPRHPSYYYVFDLLYLDGYDLTQVPLTERKALLRRALAPGDHIKLVEHIERDGERALRPRPTSGSRASSPSVRRARTRRARVAASWLKVKNVIEQEFVVGGYTEGEGSRSKTFGGLLVGYYEGDNLRFASSVGSGLTDRMLDTVKKQLEALRTDESPFANPPTVIGGRWSGGKSARCFWVEPEMVAQVKFGAWTRDGNLRAPVFLGMRDDVDPRSVRREETPHESVDVIVAEQSDPPAPAGSIERAVASVLAQLESDDEGELHPRRGWRADQAHQPRQGVLARDEGPPRPHQTRAGPILRARGGRHAAAPQGPAADPDALPERHRRAVLLPEALAIGRSRRSSRSTASRSTRRAAPATASTYSCNNLQTLIWLAQLADLEIHAWMARANPEPDAVGLPTVFSGSSAEPRCQRAELSRLHDLRPRPLHLRRQREEGRRARAQSPRLREDARDGVLTEGSAGAAAALVVREDDGQDRACTSTCRSLRHYTYDQLRAASETIGRYMLQMHPNDLTMEWADDEAHWKDLLRPQPEHARQDARRAVFAASVGRSRACRRP